MHQINRLLINICSNDLPKSKTFYTQLFQLDIGFDSDWFIQLRSKDGSLEMGIIDRKSELIPEAFQLLPQGFYLTFVVDNVDQVFDTAQTAGFEIMEAPKDTFYGQRRMLLKDPDGALVDVSSLIPNE